MPPSDDERQNELTLRAVDDTGTLSGKLLRSFAVQTPMYRRHTELVQLRLAL